MLSKAPLIVDFEKHFQANMDNVIFLHDTYKRDSGDSDYEAFLRLISNMPKKQQEKAIAERAERENLDTMIKNLESKNTLGGITIQSYGNMLKGSEHYKHFSNMYHILPVRATLRDMGDQMYSQVVHAIIIQGIVFNYTRFEFISAFEPIEATEDVERIPLEQFRLRELGEVVLEKAKKSPTGLIIN